MFKEDHLVVLNKPHGVLSHPNSVQKDTNALVRAPYDFKNECYDLGDDGRLYLIHRLDKDTSGLLLASFDLNQAKYFKKMLKEKKIRKTYLALLCGQAPNNMQLKDSVFNRLSKKKEMFLSELTLLSYFKKHDLSLVKLNPITGKTHQLRIQCYKRFLPIAGDRQYGDFKKNKWLKQRFGLRRMFLHAQKIKWLDGEKEKEFDCLLPNELEKVLEGLA